VFLFIVIVCAPCPFKKNIAGYTKKLDEEEEKKPTEGKPHQPDIWGLTKGMLKRLYILLLETIPFLVQQNVGLVPEKALSAE
jgi:hypothetical protein